VWTAYAGAPVHNSDSFSLYPLWPSESLTTRQRPLDSATAALAQASARAYAKFDGGRPVDVFASAVLAGQGFAFDAATRAGGSVSGLALAARSAPEFAYSPLETLQGLLAQMAAPCPPCCPCGPGGRLFGANSLLYTSGGGVENIGVSRAVDEMLVTSLGGVGGNVSVFPFWPSTEPAAFATLLVKGGFAVSASYSNVTRRVESPVTLSLQHALGGAASGTARLEDPWGAGSAGGVTAVCGGAPVTLAWSADGRVLSFDAPLGVVCKVGLSGEVA